MNKVNQHELGELGAAGKLVFSTYKQWPDSIECWSFGKLHAIAIADSLLRARDSCMGKDCIACFRMLQRASISQRTAPLTGCHLL